jgi:hypothetical protein
MHGIRQGSAVEVSVPGALVRVGDDDQVPLAV